MKKVKESKKTSRLPRRKRIKRKLKQAALLGGGLLGLGLGSYGGYLTYQDYKNKKNESKSEY